MTRSKRICGKWTYSKRKELEDLIKQGYSGKQIAPVVGMYHTTVYREMMRCAKGSYNADYAQKDADANQDIRNDSNRRYRKGLISEMNALQERVTALENQIKSIKQATLPAGYWSSPTCC